MPTVNIEWTVPTSSLDSSKTYNINIYATLGVEDSTYTLVDTISYKSGDSYVSTYEYIYGSRDYHFYVKYYALPADAEGSRILAWIALTVREQRLVEEFEGSIPSTFGTVSDKEKRVYLYGALQAINMVSPLTSYSLSNMPAYWEQTIKLGAMLFTYFQNFLTISIKDFTYNDNGLALNIDRGARINTALQNVLKVYNEHIKWIKMGDYPDPIGLGSYAIAVPHGRIFNMLYNIKEGS